MPTIRVKYMNEKKKFKLLDQEIRINTEHFFEMLEWGSSCNNPSQISFGNEVEMTAGDFLELLEAHHIITYTGELDESLQNS